MTENPKPEPAVKTRSLWRRLGAGGLRILVFFASLGLVVSCVLGAAGLGGAAGLLLLSSRDLTLSPVTVPVWPEWLEPVKLLHESARVYLAAGVALVLLVLPVGLALLEAIVAPRGEPERVEAGR